MLDLTTIFGLIASGGIFYLGISSGSDITLFLSLNALIIVLGGTITATIVSIPASILPHLLSAFIQLFFEPKIEPATIIIKRFVTYSELALQDGLESLPENENFKDETAFTKKGLNFLIDGRNEEFIRDVMETQVLETASRHKMISDTFITMGTFAPTFGLFGTVIGIIQVLRFVSDMSSVGGAMSIALLTTFYGIALSNFVFIPLSGKLRYRGKIEYNQKRLIIEAILCLHKGFVPLMVEQKLKSFLRDKNEF